MASLSSVSRQAPGDTHASIHHDCCVYIHPPRTHQSRHAFWSTLFSLTGHDIELPMVFGTLGKPYISSPTRSTKNRLFNIRAAQHPFGCQRRPFSCYRPHSTARGLPSWKNVALVEHNTERNVSSIPHRY